MNNIKTSKKPVNASLVLLLFVLLVTPFSANAAQEEKMLAVGETWKKDGWNLSVKAVNIDAQPGFILISLSYQGKELGDAKIEHGKSYAYMGRNPDDNEVNLFTAKVVNIFVGAGADAVRLELCWTTPMSDVQIIKASVESEQITETPVPTPTAQATPTAPGFEMVLGIIGVLAVWLMLKSDKFGGMMK